MKLRHLAVAVGGLIVIAACTRDSGYDRAYFWENYSAYNDCAAKQTEVLQGVNWDQAQAVDITIRQGIYTPATFDLLRGKPYVLRIHNNDDGLRTITANEFFTQSAVGSISEEGKSVKPETCISRVKLSPNQTTTVQLVPHREGRYRWSDNLGPAGFIWFGRDDFGAITVR
jgi:hypothetical protein